MRDRVVLNFGGGEFEESELLVQEQILKDSDGDKIEYMNFQDLRRGQKLKRKDHDPVKKATQNPTQVDLEPNRVGIWVLQFKLSKKKGSKFLKHVCTQRFNFYQNLPGETAAFCSYVRSLKEGDITVYDYRYSSSENTSFGYCRVRRTSSTRCSGI